MPSFLHNIADRAQNALNSSPIGPHVQQYTNKLSSSSHNTGDSQSGKQETGTSTKSYALENVQHQLRVLQQQYSSNTSALQRNITAQKGIAIDLEGLARDIKAQSKEMYVWGQSENEDIKDVTDRLAYLNFVHGSLALNLSKKLNSSRASLKGIRDEETALTPRRNIREGIIQQINRIKSDGQKGAAVDQKIAELESQLNKAKSDDEDVEKQYEILKRKALRENEEVKWSAIREYAEKLILLANASNSFLEALPPVPPTAENPYSGARSTASTRATVQASLNKWVTGHVKVPEFNNASTDSLEPDTRSFGVTHATELSSINALGDSSSVPATGALNTNPSPVPQPSNVQPIDISQLNQTPVQVPLQNTQDRVLSASPSSGDISPPPIQQSVPTISPTVAETGVPLTAGSTGPGPRKGSLSQQNKAPPYGSPEAIASTTTTGYPSAEDEKKRLAREERERLLNAGGPSSTPVYESAEEEKKRLERAERERVLQLGGSGGPSGSGSKGNEHREDPNDGPPPPAYHD